MGFALPGLQGGIRKGNKPVSKIIFEKWAGENSSFITPGQFQNLVQDYGYRLSPDELKLALNVLDENGDGQIQYDEFIKWWSTENRFESLKFDDEQMVVLNKATDIFRKFDADDSGAIDNHEFEALHRELLSAGVTNKDKETFIRDIDRNRDGKLSFNEYVEFLKRLGSIPQKTLLTEESLMPLKSTK